MGSRIERRAEWRVNNEWTAEQNRTGLYAIPFLIYF
jgi:hypothetical protein